MEWGTITREVRVLQRGKLKDQASKTRADKILTFAKASNPFKSNLGLPGSA